MFLISLYLTIQHNYYKFTSFAQVPYPIISPFTLRQGLLSNSTQKTQSGENLSNFTCTYLLTLLYLLSIYFSFSYFSRKEIVLFSEVNPAIPSSFHTAVAQSFLLSYGKSSDFSLSPLTFPLLFTRWLKPLPCKTLSFNLLLTASSHPVSPI